MFSVCFGSLLFLFFSFVCFFFFQSGSGFVGHMLLSPVDSPPSMSHLKSARAARLGDEGEGEGEGEGVSDELNMDFGASPNSSSNIRKPKLATFTRNKRTMQSFVTNF